jgi:hypothetical protein
VLVPPRKPRGDKRERRRERVTTGSTPVSIFLTYRLAGAKPEVVLWADESTRTTPADRHVHALHGERREVLTGPAVKFSRVPP